MYQYQYQSAVTEIGHRRDQTIRLRLLKISLLWLKVECYNFSKENLRVFQKDVRPLYITLHGGSSTESPASRLSCRCQRGGSWRQCRSLWQVHLTANHDLDALVPTCCHLILMKSALLLTDKSP